MTNALDNAGHIPVLTAEVLHNLQPGRGGLFVDCTVGLGGHARALLEAGATRLVGFDRDLDALAHAAETLAPWRDRRLIMRRCPTSRSLEPSSPQS